MSIACSFCVDKMSNASHPIKAVARLTGLTPYVIRIWEQRYQAVRPERTKTNRRLYSQLDIERFKLLRHATQAGHSISLVAQLPTEKLRELADENSRTKAAQRAGVNLSVSSESITQDCLAAMKSLDGQALEDALKHGATALGTMGLLQHVIAPFTQIIGELWIAGRITVAHEHLATSVLKNYLFNAAKPFGETKYSPRLVVATPSGQLHELGALLVGAMATQLDWQITYLGVSLPAPEIASAVRQIQARAVALSLVYPEDDSRIKAELKLLRELLPADVTILVGGRATMAYRDAIEHIGAASTGSLFDLAGKLAALRKL